jgi:hypothetical protein
LPEETEKIHDKLTCVSRCHGRVSNRVPAPTHCVQPPLPPPNIDEFSLLRFILCRTMYRKLDRRSMNFVPLRSSAASDFIACRTASNGEDNRSKAPGLDNRPPPCPLIIISEVIPISHKRDPVRILSSDSQEWNPVRRNQQQILAFCTVGGPLDPRGPLCCGVCRDLVGLADRTPTIFSSFGTNSP